MPVPLIYLISLGKITNKPTLFSLNMLSFFLLWQSVQTSNNFYHMNLSLFYFCNVLYQVRKAKIYFKRGENNDLWSDISVFPMFLSYSFCILTLWTFFPMEVSASYTLCCLRFFYRLERTLVYHRKYFLKCSVGTKLLKA